MNPQQLRELAEEVRLIAEMSDGLDHEDGVHMLAALDEVSQATSAATSMVKQRMMTLLVEPTMIAGRRWKKQMDGKWRPDHKALALRVVSYSVADKVTGELRDREDAVREAVRLMSSLFVSPATVPKTAGLDQIGVLKNQVAKWEHTGYKLVVEDIDQVSSDGEDPF